MANTKEKLIAKKYANALTLVKLSPKIIEDLELINSSLEQSEDLNSVLSNPSIRVEVKKNILREIFSKKIEEETLKTLLLLLDKRRIKLASSLLEFYRESFYKKENIELAEIQAPRELSASELEDIKILLEKSLKKTIKLTASTDKDLIAGSKIKIANKLIDSSLSSKLKQLKSLLLG